MMRQLISDSGLLSQADCKGRTRQLEAQLRDLRAELEEARSGREAAKASQVGHWLPCTPEGKHGSNTSSLSCPGSHCSTSTAGWCPMRHNHGLLE